MQAHDDPELRSRVEAQSKPSSLWTDAVEELAEELADAVVLLHVASEVGSAPEESKAIRLAARDDLARAAQMELGRRTWEVLLDEAYAKINRRILTLATEDADAQPD